MERFSWSERLRIHWNHWRRCASPSNSLVNREHGRALVRWQGILRRLPNPRIAFVKQDVNEDLYCCPCGLSAREIVESTLLRPGPVALFCRHGATFHLVQTLEDDECTIWKEKATALGWCPLEWFAGWRDCIVGKDYGQSRFSVPVESVDWGQYDLVVSLDIPVPSRVTRQFPNTVWAYYVREVKTPVHLQSLQSPLPGQDLYFAQTFRPRRPLSASHVLEFPYHLHYVGCFHDLFNERETDSSSCELSLRNGIAIDNHTMASLNCMELTRLSKFGSVISTWQCDRDISNTPAIRTLDPEFRKQFWKSKYFLITPGQRSVFGTAVVEAIAVGCLAIGSPSKVQAGYFFTPRTSAEDVATAIRRIQFFEDHPEIYRQELLRQQQLVDWLCYYRPMSDLFERIMDHQTRRNQSRTVSV